MEELITEKEGIKENMCAAASFYKDELTAAAYKLMMVDKNGVIEEFALRFSVYNFKHLAGLHKLESFKNPNSKTCFTKLLKSEITEKEIDEVLGKRRVKDRIEHLYLIKDMLSVGSEIRKSENKTFGKKIKADYILTKKTDDKRFAHLFLKETESGVLVPVSFIVHNNGKYLKKCYDRRKILSIEELPVCNAEKDKYYEKHRNKFQKAAS